MTARRWVAERGAVARGAGAAQHPRRRRAVPAGAVVLAAAAGFVLLAAVAIVAASVGPLTAHPNVAPSGPPRAVSLPGIPPMTFALPPQEPARAGDLGWLWWVGLVLAAIVAAAIAWWLTLLVRRPTRPTAAQPGAPAVPLLGAMLGSLTESAPVDLGDPRSFQPARAADDIIRSWETVEAAAAAMGSGRVASATPTEFLAAAAAGRPAAVVAAETIGTLGDPELGGAASGGVADAATVLLRLYHRARFDTSALAPGAATAARVAARALVSAWRDEPADTVAAGRS